MQKKQEFIAQIMSSKSPVRSCEDVDETALSYAEIKALCAGNPLIAEKMHLDNEVAKLRMLKAEHQSQRYRLEDDLMTRFPEQITAVTERIAGIEKDIATYTTQKERCAVVETDLSGNVSASTAFPGMTINGTYYAEKEPASKALLEACKGIIGMKTDVAIGEYMGFKMSLRYESFGKQINLLMRGAMTYQLDLGTDALGKKDLADGGIIPPFHPNCRCSLVALDTAGVRYYNGPNGAQMLHQLQIYLDGMDAAGLFALEPHYGSLRIHPDDLKWLDALAETLISGVDPEAKQTFRAILQLVEDLERNAGAAMAQSLEDAKAAALKILESTVILIEAFCENINLRLEEAWALWEEGEKLRAILVASDAALGTFISSFFSELSSRISDFKEDPNGLTLANLLTLGLVDMVQGALFRAFHLPFGAASGLRHGGIRVSSPLHQKPRLYARLL